MSRLSRYIQKVFGSDVGPSGNFGVFGSLAAGAPQYSKDPKVIQSLDAWKLAWAAATVGNKSPALQDMNSLFYVAFYQLAYLLQQGLAEWDAETTYYTNQFAARAGKMYKSLADDNTGNDPATDPTHWVEYVASIYTPPQATFSRTKLLSDMTQLVSSGVSSGGWQAIDLTPHIAAAGLNASGITVKGVLLRVHSKLGPIGFSHKTAEAGTWAWGSNTASNVLAAQCLVTTDDSDASQGDYSYGLVPLLIGNNIYYNIFSVNSTAGLLGEVHLAGFLYDQVVQL